MRARDDFIAAGDMQGVASAYEWLGDFLMKSRALDEAAAHFGGARDLFARVEQEAAVQRLLGYWAPVVADAAARADNESRPSPAPIWRTIPPSSGAPILVPRA